LDKYETIFIIDSLLKTEEIQSIVSKYERFISANGGQIETVEEWGKKRLAYEMKKRQYGYYVLIRFTGPATMIKQLDREFRLNESILRHLTLKMTKLGQKTLEKKSLQKTARENEKTPPPASESPKKEEAKTEEKEEAKTEEKEETKTEETEETKTEETEEEKKETVKPEPDKETDS
jgi:small subunit ribosomal protein S6